jgi:hypothetical protein
MYCPKCGYICEEDTKICRMCGAKIKNGEVYSSDNVGGGAHRVIVKIAIGIAVVVVIAGGIICGVLWQKNRNNNSDTVVGVTTEEDTEAIAENQKNTEYGNMDNNEGVDIVENASQADTENQTQTYETTLTGGATQLDEETLRYLAYYNKIVEYQKKYKTVVTSYTVDGLTYVELEDFDGDGKEELLICYSKDDDIYGLIGYNYKMEMWNYTEGTLKLDFERELECDSGIMFGPCDEGYMFAFPLEGVDYSYGMQAVSYQYYNGTMTELDKYTMKRIELDNPENVVDAYGNEYKQDSIQKYYINDVEVSEDDYSSKESDILDICDTSLYFDDSMRIDFLITTYNTETKESFQTLNKAIKEIQSKLDIEEKDNWKELYEDILDNAVNGHDGQAGIAGISDFIADEYMLIEVEDGIPELLIRDNDTNNMLFVKYNSYNNVSIYIFEGVDIGKSGYNVSSNVFYMFEEWGNNYECEYIYQIKDNFIEVVMYYDGSTYEWRTGELGETPSISESEEHVKEYCNLSEVILFKDVKAYNLDDIKTKIEKW